MQIDKILLKIINEKYEELKALKSQNGIFEKINHFEGNAIGQIGEEFVKSVFKECGIKMQDLGKAIHDEFDILLNNGTKIEIKTARQGLKNKTFQFNGINPHYNVKFIICIGLSAQNAYFKIVDGAKIYDHKSRKFY